MSAPTPGDPCLEPRIRPPVPGGVPVRILEVLATGTNGGAQEHVYSLVTRMDRERYDVRVVSLSHGSSVRRLEKAGIEVLYDERDERGDGPTQEDGAPVDRLGEVELEATGRLVAGGLAVHEDDGSCSEEERDEDLVQVAAQKPGGRPDVLEAERLDDP